jgi:predicted esterase
MMRTLFISLMIGLGVAHTGLGDAQVKTLVHGGRTRSYRVHLPPSYREGLPMALVFALHGYGGTAAGFEKTTGFSRIADREGFIVVYPNAVAFGPNQKQMWNGGGIFTAWWAGQVDDVSFFAMLIDAVSAQYTTDPNIIFVFGTSSGGFMAHHLGARLPLFTVPSQQVTIARSPVFPVSLLIRLESVTIFCLVKELYAPRRTGHEDFPHPALQQNSLIGRQCESTPSMPLARSLPRL